MVTVVVPEGSLSTKLPTPEFEDEDVVVVVVVIDVDDEVTGGFSI